MSGLSNVLSIGAFFTINYNPVLPVAEALDLKNEVGTANIGGVITIGHNG